MWGDGCSVSKIPYGFLDLSALFNFKYIFKSRFCFLHPNGTFCFLVVFEDWLQNTKPPSMSSKKGEGLWVFCGGGGEWVVVCHLPVIQNVFLSCSFAHTLFWLGTHVQCVALPGKACTRWWQWRLIRQRYTGCGFPAEPGQFLPAFGTKQHLLRAAFLATVVNPSEFLSHQSDCFNTANLS